MLVLLGGTSKWTLSASRAAFGALFAQFGFPVAPEHAGAGSPCGAEGSRQIDAPRGQCLGSYLEAGLCSRTRTLEVRLAWTGFSSVTARFNWRKNLGV